jgi:tetratricopeptide (TPR) repeat protein
MDLLELHPLVRRFIRTTFSELERRSFIDRLLHFYRNFMGKNKSRLSERPTFTTLQYWTQTAELDVAASRFPDAFLTLAEAANPFTGSPFSREFCRVARLLFNSVEWVENHREYKGFDEVFAAYVRMLSHLGEYSEADDLLEKYAMTVLEKDSRYIRYCDMRCYNKWLRGDYQGAITWGQMGKRLAESTGVDTSTDISLNLALAERDSGKPEVALTTFLGALKLSELIDPDEFDESVGSHHYGNIGRCLHLMGQVEPALVCYQKSAIFLEKELHAHSLMNQGYIRLWIGELLVARKQPRVGLAFLHAACGKWELIAPPKVQEIHKLMYHVKRRELLEFCSSPDECESIAKNWISGQQSDLIESSY